MVPVFRYDRRAGKSDGASDQSEKWIPLFGPMLQSGFPFRSEQDPTGAPAHVRRLPELHGILNLEQGLRWLYRI